MPQERISYFCISHQYYTSRRVLGTVTRKVNRFNQPFFEYIDASVGNKLRRAKREVKLGKKLYPERHNVADADTDEGDSDFIVDSDEETDNVDLGDADDSVDIQAPAVTAAPEPRTRADYRRIEEEKLNAALTAEQTAPPNRPPGQRSVDSQQSESESRRRPPRRVIIEDSESDLESDGEQDFDSDDASGNAGTIAEQPAPPARPPGQRSAPATRSQSAARRRRAPKKIIEESESESESDANSDFEVNEDSVLYCSLGMCFPGCESR